MAAQMMTLMLDGWSIGPEFALFFFLAIGAISLFGFLSVAAWAGSRQAERATYYNAEMMKRIAEAGGERNPALEYLREKERIKAAKRMEGFRLAGLINIGIGAGVMVFLHQLAPVHGLYLVGLIPLFIGLALAVFGYGVGPKSTS
jgi:hypothetical protein